MKDSSDGNGQLFDSGRGWGAGDRLAKVKASDQPDKEFRLTKGSTYIVRSLHEKESALVTEGVYDGLASLTNAYAIVMKVKGKNGKELIRLIPSHYITSIDVVDQKEEKEVEIKEKETTDKYFQ